MNYTTVKNENSEINNTQDLNLAGLFKKMELTFQRSLSAREMQDFVSIYRDMNLSVEILNIILDFANCVNIKNIRYIEKLAIHLSKLQVNDSETAKKILDLNKKRPYIGFAKTTQPRNSRNLKIN